MRDDFQFDPQLLDLHLGRLSDAERERVRQRIAADPRAAQEHEALGGVFAALGSYQPEAAPADLTAGVMARIAQAPPLRVMPREKESKRLTFGDTVVMRRVFGLREVIASAAMIVLMVGVGVPSLLQLRERGQRVACAAQLGQLGQGMAMYGSTFGDALPFVGWSPHVAWSPSTDAGVTQQPNRRHLYPLVRGGTVDPRYFVCPSTADVPMSRQQIKQFDDFPDSRNVSFAYQNMAGARPTRRDNADLPIAADDNPVFDNGRFLLSDLPTQLGLRKASESNSRAHGGHGQNILTLGGRVKWTESPNCGIDGDNIWTLQKVEKYTGHEGPQAATDAHLLK